VKHPIVGDPVYGQSEKNMVKFLDKVLTPEDRIKNSGATRLLLHANELEFNLYNQEYHFKSKVNFLQEIRKSLGVDLV
jgi:23S rRNA pseudouridine1911/1915/1917 synthase